MAVTDYKKAWKMALAELDRARVEIGRLRGINLELSADNLTLMVEIRRLRTPVQQAEFPWEDKKRPCIREMHGLRRTGDKAPVTQ